MKTRDPQLSFRLGPDAAANESDWAEGRTIAFLGDKVTLTLDTDHKHAKLVGSTLHLPLPPEATSRQIRDAAEAWLRREAQHLLTEAIHRHAARLKLTPPRLTLSFAARGHWVQTEADCLRCNWRLVEQTMDVIDQVVGRAVAMLPPPAAEGDLFGALG